MYSQINQEKSPLVDDDDFWKSLADPNRRKILKFLSSEDLTPTELNRRLDLSQPALASHLRILRGANLVYQERKGQNKLYHFNNERFSDIMPFIEEFFVKDRFIKMMTQKSRTSLSESLISRVSSK